MRKLAVYVLAACSLVSSSCATLLKGTKDEITVVSDPPGAQVTSNEQQEGPTPVTFTVPSKQDLDITVAKAAYQPQDLQDPASFRWGYEAWLFIEWVIPMVVDLSDGAAWGHDHLTMTAHLEPNGQASSAAAAAVSSPAAGAPLPASAESEDRASPAPSPAGRTEAVAVAPLPPPVAVPSASTARQPAASAAPALPEQRRGECASPPRRKCAARLPFHFPSNPRSDSVDFAEPASE